MFKTFLIAALISLSTSLWAAKEVYTIDGAHSSVTFSIKHLVSKVKGNFADVSGTIEADDKKPTDSVVSATIKADSISTSNAKRDGHLKGPDFFDVKKFPTITFKSGKITGSGKKFKMEGKLNMHGVEKPVVLDVEYMGTQKDPWGNDKAGFSATTKVKRTDFGIVYNKTLEKGGLLLGEDVEVQLDIEAQKEAPKKDDAKK